MSEPYIGPGWQELAAVYRRSGLGLAIGAGLSRGSCIPDWAGLLEGIAQEICGQDGVELVRKLRKEGYSLPFVASSLKARCSPDEDFIGIVHRVLFRSFPFRGRDINGTARKEFVEWIQAHNTALNAVASFCVVPEEGKGGYVINPRVSGIVNFNLDTLLREYVDARYGFPSLLRNIVGVAGTTMYGRINVYHMHGFLRFDVDGGSMKAGLPPRLVLSEEEYFEYFNSPTSLFNYTFLTLLQQHSFLFIGLSMQDDNIRRFLHISTTERMRGYQDKQYSDAEARVVRHFVVHRRSEAQNHDLDNARELTLRRLGTRVLWVDDYSDIARCLGRVYEFAGGNWTSVYESNEVSDIPKCASDPTDGERRQAPN